MLYNVFDNKTGSGKASKIKANVNEVLAQELQKPLIKNFKKRKVYGSLKGNIWAAYLAKMKSLSSKNRSVLAEYNMKWLLSRSITSYQK